LLQRSDKAQRIYQKVAAAFTAAALPLCALRFVVTADEYMCLCIG
jgi:hypothetical protein